MFAYEKFRSSWSITSRCRSWRALSGNHRIRPIVKRSEVWMDRRRENRAGTISSRHRIVLSWDFTCIWHCLATVCYPANCKAIKLKLALSFLLIPFSFSRTCGLVCNFCIVMKTHILTLTSAACALLYIASVGGTPIHVPAKRHKISLTRYDAAKAGSAVGSGGQSFAVGKQGQIGYQNGSGKLLRCWRDQVGVANKW